MSRAAWKCWKEVPVTEWTGLPKYKSHAYSRMQQVNKRNGVAIVLQPNTTKLQSTVTGMNFTATTNIDWNIWWANRQLNNPSKTLTTRDEYAAEYRLVCWICKQQRKRNRQVKGEQEKAQIWNHGWWSGSCNGPYSVKILDNRYTQTDQVYVGRRKQ